MSQKDGANYVVLYQMLCLKTINTGGRFSRTIGEIVIPYDVNKIQRDCKWFSLDTIRVALELYKRFGLVYEEQDGTLVITDHHNLVGSETDWKDQKAAQREKKLPKLQGCKRLNANSLLLPSGNIQTVDEKRYGGHGMKAFDLSGGKCEMCGSYEDLCIHHANGYSNEQEDLYILCKTCHGIAHSVSTAPDWLHHSWVVCGQYGGQEGGQVHQDVQQTVHTDIRDKILDIRDKENRGEDTTSSSTDISSSLSPKENIDIESKDSIDVSSSKAKDGMSRFTAQMEKPTTAAEYLIGMGIDLGDYFIAEQYRGFLEEGMEESAIMYAASLAKSINKVSWAYIKAILNRWMVKGIKTRAQAEEEEKQRGKESEANGNGRYSDHRRKNHEGPRTDYGIKTRFAGHRYDADGNDITGQDGT